MIQGIDRLFDYLCDARGALTTLSAEILGELIPMIYTASIYSHTYKRLHREYLLLACVGGGVLAAALACTPRRNERWSWKEVAETACLIASVALIGHVAWNDFSLARLCAPWITHKKNLHRIATAFPYAYTQTNF